MGQQSWILMATAAALGVVHTLLGPDHYVPFVALARACRWSVRWTAVITALCGAAHVAGSVAIGALGLLTGTLLERLEAFESLRGNAAGWLLTGFGLAWLTWGVMRIVRAVPGSAADGREEETIATFRNCDPAQRGGNRRELSPAGGQPRSVVPERAGFASWILFLIFVLGPCEVLIPLLMYPAAQANWLAVVSVATVFGAATVLTMVAAVLVLHTGLGRIRFPERQGFAPFAAGLAILACGLAVTFGL